MNHLFSYSLSDAEHRFIAVINYYSHLLFSLAGVPSVDSNSNGSNGAGGVGDRDIVHVETGSHDIGYTQYKNTTSELLSSKTSLI